MPTAAVACLSSQQVDELVCSPASHPPTTVWPLCPWPLWAFLPRLSANTKRSLQPDAGNANWLILFPTCGVRDLARSSPCRCIFALLASPTSDPIISASGRRQLQR